METPTPCPSGALAFGPRKVIPADRIDDALVNPSIIAHWINISMRAPRRMTFGSSLHQESIFDDTDDAWCGCAATRS
jgi:hypothetical protein